MKCFLFVQPVLNDTLDSLQRRSRSPAAAPWSVPSVWRKHQFYILRSLRYRTSLQNRRVLDLNWLNSSDFKESATGAAFAKNQAFPSCAAATPVNRANIDFWICLKVRATLEQPKGYIELMYQILVTMRRKWKCLFQAS